MTGTPTTGKKSRQTRGHRDRTQDRREDKTSLVPTKIGETPGLPTGLQLGVTVVGPVAVVETTDIGRVDTTLVGAPSRSPSRRLERRNGRPRPSHPSPS